MHVSLWLEAEHGKRMSHVLGLAMEYFHEGQEDKDSSQ